MLLPWGTIMSDKWNFLELQDDKEREEFAAENLAASVQLAIQKAMMRNSVSQKQLAERLGVSTARISQILSAHGRNLTLKTLGRIANALEEDFEFIAVRDVQELKAQPKLRDSVSRLEELRQQWDAIESPWVDRTANDNRFPWKHAA